MKAVSVLFNEKHEFTFRDVSGRKFTVQFLNFRCAVLHGNDLFCYSR